MSHFHITSSSHQSLLYELIQERTLILSHSQCFHKTKLLTDTLLLDHFFTKLLNK